MMDETRVTSLLQSLAAQYNATEYFVEDPISFPKHFYELYLDGKASLCDIECAAVIAAHLAWGRRDMIVRDCNRAMDEMGWSPYEYVMHGVFRDDATSLHRTVMWRDFAGICERLKRFYSENSSLERLSASQMRVMVYGQKEDTAAANKKIHMLRRWMVRDDGIVDLGVWKSIPKRDLLIPLDVHVHRSALNLGITSRKAADYKTAREITDFLLRVFPEDPCLGDFALFAASCVK